MQKIERNVCNREPHKLREAANNIRMFLNHFPENKIISLETEFLARFKFRQIQDLGRNLSTGKYLTG